MGLLSPSGAASGGGGSSSDLSATPGTDTVTIGNTGGDDATIPAATASTAGIMSAAMFALLGADSRLYPLGLSSTVERQDDTTLTLEDALSADFPDGTYSGIGILVKDADSLATDHSFTVDKDSGSGTVTGLFYGQDVDSNQFTFTNFGTSVNSPSTTAERGVFFTISFTVSGGGAVVGLKWGQQSANSGEKSYLLAGTSLLLFKVA